MGNRQRIGEFRQNEAARIVNAALPSRNGGLADADAGGEITDFKGEVFLLKRGRKEIGVFVVKPDGKGIAGLVPKKRLSSGAYEAVFRWTRGGKAHVKTIRFKTG